MTSTTDLSVIIVNYNTKDLLDQCLNSIYTINHKYNLEIFVVDNASIDGSLELVKGKYPQVKLIANQENLGFAKANNLAILKSSGRYVLLLNSDTIILPGSFDLVIDFMDQNPQVGITGCKVERANGSLDLACRRSFPTPRVAFYRMVGLSKLFPKHREFGRYNLLYLDENEAYQVDSVMGAYMLVRREALDQAGILDEDFFMYGEDLDWCYRIKEKGWQVYYYPAARIIHLKGESSKKQSYRMIYEFHRAMVLFHRKHFACKIFFLFNWLIYLGIGLRLGLLMVKNFFASEKKVSK